MKRIVLIGILSLGSGVQAEPLSYDYVYASRTDTEVNNQDAEGDTFGLFTEFAEHWHVTVSQGDAGWGPAGAEQLTTRFGLGGQVFLSDRTLLAPTLSVLRIETDTPAASNDETAYAVQLDLRHRITDRLELVTGVRHLDLDAGSRSGVEAGLMFHLNNWVAIGGIARHEDSVNSMEWTFRIYY